MRRMCLIKPTPLIAGLLTGLLFAIVAIPLSAATVKAEPHPFYDVTKEVTLSGPISGIYKKPAAGLIPGAHVMLQTGSGTVDASLGRWGLLGSPAIANGEQVTVRGVMKTIRNKEVFFVRTMEVGGHTYNIRNQHGVPLYPRERATQKTAQKGVSL
jgi:hypothetical protein